MRKPIWIREGFRNMKAYVKYMTKFGYWGKHPNAPPRITVWDQIQRGKTMPKVPLCCLFKDVIGCQSGLHE